jgi:hypothetical protein
MGAFASAQNASLARWAHARRRRSICINPIGWTDCANACWRLGAGGLRGLRATRLHLDVAVGPGEGAVHLSRWKNGACWR